MRAPVLLMWACLSVSACGPTTRYVFSLADAHTDNDRASAVDECARLVADPRADVDVREASARTLGRLSAPSESAIAALGRVATNEGEADKLRAMAAWALGQMRSPASLEMLLRVIRTRLTEQSAYYVLEALARHHAIVVESDERRVEVVEALTFFRGNHRGRVPPMYEVLADNVRSLPVDIRVLERAINGAHSSSPLSSSPHSSFSSPSLSPSPPASAFGPAGSSSSSSSSSPAASAASASAFGPAGSSSSSSSSFSGAAAVSSSSAAESARLAREAVYASALALLMGLDQRKDELSIGAAEWQERVEAAVRQLRRVLALHSPECTRLVLWWIGRLSDVPAVARAAYPLVVDVLSKQRALPSDGGGSRADMSTGTGPGSGTGTGVAVGTAMRSVADAGAQATESERMIAVWALARMRLHLLGPEYALSGILFADPDEEVLRALADVAESGPGPRGFDVLIEQPVGTGRGK